MTGAEVVAVVSICATILVAGIGGGVQLWLQRMRDRAERDKARDERWLDHRRDLYAQFLTGVDVCMQYAHERGLFIYSLLNGQMGEFPSGEEPDFEGSSDVSGGIRLCVQALAQMRLFAPDSVTSPAQEFVQATRVTEHFGGMDVVRAQLAVKDRAGDGGGELAEGFAGSESTHGDERDEVAQRVVAAMRADLGADQTTGVTFGDPTQPIPYL